MRTTTAILTAIIALLTLLPPKTITDVRTIVVTQRTVETVKTSETPKYVYVPYEVTAYTVGYESTGKRPGDPKYGITASGVKVRRYHTVACPPSMAFGTKVYIPTLDRVYTCDDRGLAITEGHLDVYMRDVKAAMTFGRQTLDVLILPPLKATMTSKDVK